ncbi:MAG: histidine kinase dimerization/phosphoacceptor domain-containing protein, partial [Actinomycetota bacterium]
MIIVAPVAVVALGVLLWLLIKRSPRAVLALCVAGILGLATLAAARGAPAGGAALVLIAGGAALVWFVLFSGRVKTATPAFRARVVHWLFTAFFIAYAGGIALWLGAGLLAAIAGHSDGLHERMHAYGGSPDVVKVHADDIAPFSVDGSRRIKEMTLRAGTTTTIEFSNGAADTETACAFVRCTKEDRELGIVSIQHNISIYRSSGEAVFVGEKTYASINPNEDRYNQEDFVVIERFVAPEEGTYVFRCDLHPLQMRGSVRVLPASAPLTHPDENPGTRDIARHIAEVSHEAESTSDAVLDYAFSVLSLALGVFLVLLRPRERMARVFGVAMVGTAAAYNLQSHAALAATESFDFLHSLLHPITGITYIYALVMFPDGRLIPRFKNARIRLGYSLVFFVASMMILGIGGTILPDFNQHPAALVLMFGMVIPVIGIVAQLYRLRRAPNAEARQQSRLLLIALGASFAFGLVLLLALGIDLRTLINPVGADPTRIVAVDARAFRVFQPLFVVIPLALFLGILRYRLWDIDLVVRRTIVYGALAGFIGAVYVGIVVGLGRTVGARTGLSIAATVLVAVAFDPLRTRLQAFANRLVYGERAAPYDVMAHLSHRLSDMRAVADMLPAVGEEVARAVSAERVRATLLLPSGDTFSATYPPDSDESTPYERTMTLTHQGEEVGELAIAKRPGDSLRAAENRLLRAIGSQVALAMHSLRLAERLRGRLTDLERTAEQLDASRRRIVDAQNEERIRLEREIHDRVETRLVAIAATVDGAGRDGEETVDRLNDAAAEANEVQETLRELARGIFPP